MTEIAIESQHNLVQIVGDQITTTSLKVAEVFEKRHADVLRAIQTLDCSEEFSQRNFALTEYTDVQGKKRPAFNLTRDGFSFLVMGFTGERAAYWKERFIEAFNQMADKLRQPIAPAIPQTLPEALRLAADEHERANKAEAALSEAKPKIAALNRIGAAQGHLCLRDAAKTLKMAPLAFNRFLSEQGWIYKKSGSKSWIAYQEKIKAGYLDHSEFTYKDDDGEERVSTQVRVTGKGMIKIAEILENEIL